MSGVWGKNLEVSIFGESHGVAIGITIHGLPAGVEVDMDFVRSEMARRAPGSSALTTPRKEKDETEILSGMLDGKTTGAPLTAIIWNTNTKSKDYSELKRKMRPGQADYPGRVRYDGFNDYRGSGHFSGRITAPLVFAGAIAQQILAEKGVYIGSHLTSVGEIEDRRFDFEDMTKENFQILKGEHLPLLEKDKEEEITNFVRQAKADGDSVGGTAEVAIIGMPAGVGNPFFESIESNLAQLLYSVPAVKGVEFGSGFDIAKMFGSEANDSYYYDEEGNIKTRTNHNGGVTGGITNGMPVVYRVAIKPPASITKEQDTIDIESQENTKLEVHGRHDPIIVPRAMPVLEAVSAICMLDFLL